MAQINTLSIYLAGPSSFAYWIYAWHMLHEFFKWYEVSWDVVLHSKCCQMPTIKKSDKFRGIQK